MHCCGNRPVAQIPQCNSHVSHDAPFCYRNVTERCTCAYPVTKLVHCGIFVRLLHCGICEIGHSDLMLWNCDRSHRYNYSINSNLKLWIYCYIVKNNTLYFVGSQSSDFNMIYTVINFKLPLIKTSFTKTETFKRCKKGSLKLYALVNWIQHHQNCIRLLVKIWPPSFCLCSTGNIHTVKSLI